MRLTRFTDYSLRTLIYLGLHGDRLASIADIARAYRVKENHLTKVVHHLGRIGLVETVRGRQGGLRLARPAVEVSLGEVVRQTEETCAVVECFNSNACPLTGVCQLECILHDATAAFLGVLDRYTLQDLLNAGRATLAARLGLPTARPTPAAPSVRMDGLSVPFKAV